MRRGVIKKDHRGKIPLEIAARDMHVKCVMILLRYEQEKIELQVVIVLITLNICFMNQWQYNRLINITKPITA